MVNFGFNSISRRAVTKLLSKKEKDKSSKPYMLRLKRASYSFDSTNNIEFGRRKGSKDKKKRKVINNSPSADGQAPLNEIGQQRTGYKYYRKRRALGFIGATAGLGGVAGAALGSTIGAVVRKPKEGAAIGAVIGASSLGGASLLEHASNKHSPFYQKKLFNKKK